MSLAGALAIAFGLVGIDLAHALEKIVNVGAVHLGGGGSTTGSGSIRATAAGASFLILIGHKLI